MTTAALDATVLIATYNRAAFLDRTLDSIRALRLRAGRSWETIVVDNNSSDGTRQVVERHARDFPVPLHYLVEGRQGRSSALNTGIAASAGAIIAMTDDDVRVEPQWLDTVCDALEAASPAIAYAGGPVRPLWESPPPRWLDLTRGDLWGTIAIQDHGDHMFVYEDARKVPLGANMAARRTLFESAGTFRADLGRTSGRWLLGQEVPELLLRARAKGFRGVYLPSMQVHHHVPSSRLTPAYFRRWWFGKGVSRAALDRLQPVTELGLDLRVTPHVLRLPRYMYGSALRDAAGYVLNRLRGRTAEAFRHEMMLAYFAGYARARWSPSAADVSGPRIPSAQAGDHLA